MDRWDDSYFLRRLDKQGWALLIHTTQHFIEVAKKRGGDAKIVGNVVAEKKGGWDEIAIVHYASIKHFCDMLAGEDYQAINEKFRLPVSFTTQSRLWQREI